MNATMTRHPVTFLLTALLLLGAAACDDGEDYADPLCGEGDRFEYSEEEFCLYRQEIIEEGFRCPMGVPNRHDLDGFTACAPDASLPDGFEEGVHELDGYRPSNTPGDNNRDNNNGAVCDDGPRGDGSHHCYSVADPDHTFLPDCEQSPDLWRVFAIDDDTAYIVPRPDALGLEFGLCDDPELGDLFDRNGLCVELAAPDVVNAMTPADAIAIARALHDHIRFTANVASDGSAWISPFPVPTLQIAACDAATDPGDVLATDCQNNVDPYRVEDACPNLAVVRTQAEAEAMAEALNALFGVE